MFSVISVYYNIRNILPNSGTFLFEHPVYVHTALSVSFQVFYAESDKGLKGPKHVACTKTHNSVRRY